MKITATLLALFGFCVMLMSNTALAQDLVDGPCEALDRLVNQCSEDQKCESVAKCAAKIDNAALIAAPCADAGALVCEPIADCCEACASAYGEYYECVKNNGTSTDDICDVDCENFSSAPGSNLAWATVGAAVISGVVQVFLV